MICFQIWCGQILICNYLRHVHLQCYVLVELFVLPVMALTIRSFQCWSINMLIIRTNDNSIIFHDAKGLSSSGCYGEHWKCQTVTDSDHYSVEHPVISGFKAGKNTNGKVKLLLILPTLNQSSKYLFPRNHNASSTSCTTGHWAFS